MCRLNVKSGLRFTIFTVGILLFEHFTKCTVPSEYRIIGTYIIYLFMNAYFFFFC